MARLLVLAALALLAPGLAASAEFSGRGVFAFASGSGCPIAAGTGENCNRLALDDEDTRATLDEATHTLRFANGRSYDGKRIVGDVVLQGSGRTADGQRVPLSFHALLSRSGNDWSFSSHAHAPVRGEFSEIRIDPWQLVVGEAGGERVLFSSAQVVEALAKPSLTARLADELVQVRDNRESAARDADITVGLGVSKAVKWVARTRFVTTRNRPLAEAMREGTWSLELQALSGRIPRQVVQRDLFLYGLESQALLQPLLQRGFRKNEKLTIGATGGKGFVRYDGQQREFAGADATARGFLQGSFLGLVLGWQQQQLQPVALDAKAGSNGR
jgi:hypothetical protein